MTTVKNIATELYNCYIDCLEQTPEITIGISTIIILLLCLLLIILLVRTYKTSKLKEQLDQNTEQVEAIDIAVNQICDDLNRISANKDSKEDFSQAVDSLVKPLDEDEPKEDTEVLGANSKIKQEKEAPPVAENRADCERPIHKTEIIYIDNRRLENAEAGNGLEELKKFIVDCAGGTGEKVVVTTPDDIEIEAKKPKHDKPDVEDKPTRIDAQSQTGRSHGGGKRIYTDRNCNISKTGKTYTEEELYRRIKD